MVLRSAAFDDLDTAKDDSLEIGSAVGPNGQVSGSNAHISMALSSWAIAILIDLDDDVLFQGRDGTTK